MSINPRRILYEDEHLLAIEKLSGELVVQGKGRVEKLPLLDFLKKDYPGLRALHRIDFETSGVVVFAKTRAAHASVLASKFQGWKKVYKTLVLGRMPQREGVIRVPLPARENPKRNGVMLRCSARASKHRHVSHFEGPAAHLSVTQLPLTPTPDFPVFDRLSERGAPPVQGLERQGDTVRSSLMSQTSGVKGELVEAVTRYRVLENFGDVSSVEVEIETGRHHQIRRHFAALGHPLILDEVYGQKGFNRKCTKVLGYRKFFLHASSLELPHPVTGKVVRIEAKLPRAFEEVLGKLRGE